MECIKPVIVQPKLRKLMLPCGKCMACLVNKRSDWAFRLTQEHKASKTAYFVTLTYDRKHLPNNGSLDKTDLQKYLKRLRKRDEKNRIRYYAVGEYGGTTQRPHYHALIFNSTETDIRQAWQMGIVHVGSVSSASVAYTLKYIVQPDVTPKQKQYFDEATGKYKDVYQKPFAVMSRRYGIGAHYLTDEMVAWHHSGGKNYTTLPGGQKIRLPRFYKEKIWPKRYLPYKQTSPGNYVTLFDGLKLPGRIPLEDYYYTEREKVFNQSAYDARQKRYQELRWYIKTYGKEAKIKQTEMRNAVLLRVKTKVAFTQTL